MPLPMRRSYLACSVSALVMSATFAWAQESATDPASQEPETLIEGETTGTFAVDPDRVGTAAEALAGRTVADVEGMEVFDSNGDKIGDVQQVAENDRGGVYVIVAADSDSTWLSEGEHAIPLIAFDYNQDANALVLRDDLAQTMAPGVTATADPANTGTSRVYSVMDSGAAIGQPDLEAYQVAEMRDEDVDGDVDLGDVDLTDTSDPRVVGDSRQILRDENITDLEGRDILSHDGEDIANVEAVAYDGQGQVYLIARFGGFLGLGEEYRAVPLDAFNYSLEDEAFVFTEGGEETLEALPAWDYDQPGYTVVESDLDWSAFEGSTFAQDANPQPGQSGTGAAVAGTEQSPATPGDARDVLEREGVTELEGMDILSPETGDDIGTVEDVAQDGQGRLHLIVSLDDGVLGIGDSERVVPIDAFDYHPEENALVLRDISREALEAMPEWDSDNPQYALIESDLDWAAISRTDAATAEAPLTDDGSATGATGQAMMEEPAPATMGTSGQAATEEPVTGTGDATITEQAAAEEPVTGTEDTDTTGQAAAPDETAAAVEPAAGAEQGVPPTDDAAVAVEDTETSTGNARELLQQAGVADVTGMDIVNAEGTDIGTVDDVAQDAEGKLYLVVSLDDGILGMGDSKRLVSLDAFDYLPEDEVLYLRDISEEALEAMAEWDDDHTAYTVIDGDDIDWSLYH
jgi:ribosomal 30S subunit maturation factor RimM